MAIIGLLASGLLPILSGPALATASLPAPLTLPMPRPASATTAIAASPASLVTSMMLADAAAPGLQITYDSAVLNRPDNYVPINGQGAEMAAIPRDAHDMANGGIPQFRRPDSFTEAYRPGNQWMFKVLSIDLDQN